ncbi:adenosine 3'-phospho 5'-phosphosulfate transporter 2 isoform X2 [Pantherophis guttatus]|uniref:Adenosine 3'-phospho 5'-phosphosulfate transporter 2 n=1 Tax=Pantherophis guttatus TaxID=94885 RepID=A0A6P9CZX3_PANGU|nr:adenosine 3'-phospho 5'-phosphosulfate transporter 2 isoform X2 [Pantherophis guttatus]
MSWLGRQILKKSYTSMMNEWENQWKPAAPAAAATISFPTSRKIRSRFAATARSIPFGRPEEGSEAAKGAAPSPSFQAKPSKRRVTDVGACNQTGLLTTECRRLGIMDMKFNSSRKYVSISIPSKSQAMSPHIKSVDDIIVLGINLSKFNKPTQFFICVLGVFLFYLIYGYLQELIFSVEGFKSFGWYLTLVQFGFYSIFGLIELQLIQDKRRRIPGKTYMIIAFLTVGTMGLSNTSLGYLNYPTQVIFKCCKLIPVMIGGVFIQGKRYNIVDVSAAVCMSLGLIWFTLADSTIAPNFNLTGVVLISLALCADAIIGNVQEKAMKLHSGSNSEMVSCTFYWD